MKIAIITGTMPDIIKQAPLVWEAEKRGHEVLLIHTMQHSDDNFYRGMYNSIGLRNPDYELKLPFSISNTIGQLQELFKEIKPDIILPHGDTTTAMSSAVAAHYVGIPVGHIEAGLRSGSREPWPEQTNTRIVGACADLHFAPTQKNRLDLLVEGYHKDDVLVTGNTVIDMVRLLSKEITTWEERQKIYVSAHRGENTMHYDRYSGIINFINYLAENTNYEINFVKRRRTDEALAQHNLKLSDKIIVHNNLAYPDNLKLMNECKYILTDSGSIQEEASAIHVPCLTLRWDTDRPETIDAGCNIIGTTNFEKLKNMWEQLQLEAEDMRKVECPYGDGYASEYIITIIENKKDKLIRWNHE